MTNGFLQSITDPGNQYGDDERQTDDDGQTSPGDESHDDRHDETRTDHDDAKESPPFNKDGEDATNDDERTLRSHADDETRERTHDRHDAQTCETPHPSKD